MSSFAEPAAPSGGLDFKTLNGSLLIIEVLSLEDHVPTVHTKPGEKSPAIRANVTVLDGAQAGNVNEDTLIFPKILQSQLRSKVGQKVVGRLGQGQGKPGQDPPWTLAVATPDDYAVAEAYVAKNAAPAFTGADARPPF